MPSAKTVAVLPIVTHGSNVDFERMDLLDDVLEDRAITFDDNKFRVKFDNVMHQFGALPF